MFTLEYAIVDYEPVERLDEAVFRSGTLAMAAEEGRLEFSRVEAAPDAVGELGRTARSLVAPVMPLTLIHPVESAAEPTADDVTWGVRAVGADTSPFDGSGVTVAVLDTGIDADHPAFAGVELVERDFTGEGNGDDEGHGTHCAGTIFGRDVDGVRIGVAPGIERALIGKVLGAQGGSTASILEAITWALAEGAQVISMSLGIDFPGMVERLRDRGLPGEAATSLGLAAYRDNVSVFGDLADLAESAGPFGRGALLIAAAGNESRRDDFVIDKAPPSTARGVVAVGAVGAADDGFVVAPFSNTNPDLSGPGVNITSARAGGGLVGMSGTSMATPHVAGVAALWAQKLRDQGALTVGLLQSNLVARTLPLPLGFVDVGSGLVHAPQE